MFYRQSVNDIKLVILSLDGGLLDLNRLRYNYFNRICKKHNAPVSKETFVQNLGNYKTMYNCSPIQDKVSNEKLNEVVEKDLYEYAKLKQSIKKEGTDELLQFLRQKEYKIAVVTTHKAKRAIQYLQLTKIYHDIDFVIGGDSHYEPLPDSAILHKVSEQMNISAEQTLVLASFPSMVVAANEAHMNVVYVEDILPTSPSIQARTYKSAKNNLELINILLFAKYDTVEMYSPILGLSKNMDLLTLEKTYQHLLQEYHDDPRILEVVRKTYRHYLMEISHTNQPTSNTSNRPVQKTSMFKDEPLEMAFDMDDIDIPEPIIEKQTTPEPQRKTVQRQWQDTFEDNSNSIFDTGPVILQKVAGIREEPYYQSPRLEEPVSKTEYEADPFYQSSQLEKPVKEMVLKEDSTANPLDFHTTASSLNTLMDQVNNNAKQEETKEPTLIIDSKPNKPIASIEPKQEPIKVTKRMKFKKQNTAKIDTDEETKKPIRFTDRILDFLYLTALSFIGAFVGILLYMMVQDFIESKGIVSGFIKSLIDLYVNAVRGCYQLIFNGIHAVLSFIPDYNTLLKGNDFISGTGIEIVMFVFFNVLVMYIFRWLYHKLGKEEFDD